MSEVVVEELPYKKPRRSRSGTAQFHMSRKAVDQSLEAIFQLTDRQILDLMIEARFGSRDTIRCPHCGSIGRHYWRGFDKRWTCKGCRSTFSITSQTVFANHKLPLKRLVGAMLSFVNSAAGQPALELKRHMNTTYNTTFTLQAKLRESFVRGYNVGLLNGDIEMDGAHQSGYRSAEKRGKPQITQPFKADTPEKDVSRTMMAGAEQAAREEGKKPRKGPKKKTEGAIDPDFGRKLPANRRILFTVCKRSGVKGRGAAATRVAIGLVEDSKVAESIMRAHIAKPESYLNTDSSHAYKQADRPDPERKFIEHRTVEHSVRLVGPSGENNNQAEELNGRFDRSEKGIYLNIEPKYMLDYAAETAFRSDTRRLSNGKQLQIMLNVAGSVGLSEFWRGFTRGRHRTVELIHPQPQPAPASGPRKGLRAVSGASGRPPR